MSEIENLPPTAADNSLICMPAKIYILIAIVLILITLIIHSVKDGFLTGFFVSLSQLCCAILCFLLFIGICTVSPTLAWILIIVSILCQVISAISSLLGYSKFTFTTTS